MPTIRVRRPGATSSTMPSPMPNHPNADASLSPTPREPGPDRRIFGSPSERVMFVIKLMLLPPFGSGPQHNFDAGILLVAEHLVHLRPVLEFCLVSDDE